MHRDADDRDFRHHAGIRTFATSTDYIRNQPFNMKYELVLMLKVSAYQRFQKEKSWCSLEC
jgi:hypothetical protein